MMVFGGDLGPGEVEINPAVYGVMLVGKDRTYMTLKVFNDKTTAAEHAKTFVSGYVVRITGTNQ